MTSSAIPGTIGDKIFRYAFDTQRIEPEERSKSQSPFSNAKGIYATPLVCKSWTDPARRALFRRCAVWTSSKDTHGTRDHDAKIFFEDWALPLQMLDRELGAGWNLGSYILEIKLIVEPFPSPSKVSSGSNNNGTHHPTPDPGVNLWENSLQKLTNLKGVNIQLNTANPSQAQQYLSTLSLSVVVLQLRNIEKIGLVFPPRYTALKLDSLLDLFPNPSSLSLLETVKEFVMDVDDSLHNRRIQEIRDVLPHLSKLRLTGVKADVALVKSWLGAPFASSQASPSATSVSTSQFRAKLRELEITGSDLVSGACYLKFLPGLELTSFVGEVTGYQRAQVLAKIDSGSTFRGKRNKNSSPEILRRELDPFDHIVPRLHVLRCLELRECGFTGKIFSLCPPTLMSLTLTGCLEITRNDVFFMLQQQPTPFLARTLPSLRFLSLVFYGQPKQHESWNYDRTWPNFTQERDDQRAGRISGGDDPRVDALKFQVIYGPRASQLHAYHFKFCEALPKTRARKNKPAPRSESPEVLIPSEMYGNEPQSARWNHLLIGDDPGRWVRTLRR